MGRLAQALARSGQVDIKLTYPEDLKLIEAILSSRQEVSALRIGQGFDVPWVEPGDGMTLGGLWVPWISNRRAQRW